MPRYIDTDLCKMLGATCIAIRLTSTGELFPILSLDAIPTADVRENVRGEWIKGGEQPYFRKHFDIVVCSVCNKRGEQRWNYCPNCGADMRGEKNE